MTLSIGGISIGGENPCRFVAEVSNAHNGSLDRAHDLVDAVKRTGAEFVKFQAFTVEELIALRGDGPAPAQWGEQGYTMRTLYERAQTPLSWLRELFNHAHDVGLVPFSSVFGAESLAVLEACGCPAYKVARLDSHHRALADLVMATGKPLLVSTNEKPWDLPAGPAYLYCAPGYPTLAEDVALPEFVDALHCTGCECEAGFYLGLSSHCLDSRLPIAAVARGAKLLEFHVQLDDEPSELEANVSLRISEFARMVADVRATECLLG